MTRTSTKNNTRLTNSRTSLRKRTSSKRKQSRRSSQNRKQHTHKHKLGGGLNDDVLKRGGKLFVKGDPQTPDENYQLETYNVTKEDRESKCFIAKLNFAQENIPVICLVDDNTIRGIYPFDTNSNSDVVLKSSQSIDIVKKEINSDGTTKIVESGIRVPFFGTRDTDKIGLFFTDANADAFKTELTNYDGSNYDKPYTLNSRRNMDKWLRAPANMLRSGVRQSAGWDKTKYANTGGVPGTITSAGKIGLGAAGVAAEAGLGAGLGAAGVGLGAAGVATAIGLGAAATGVTAARHGLKNIVSGIPHTFKQTKATLSGDEERAAELTTFTVKQIKNYLQSSDKDIGAVDLMNAVELMNDMNRINKTLEHKMKEGYKTIKERYKTIKDGLPKMGNLLQGNASNQPAYDTRLSSDLSPRGSSALG